MRPVVSIQDSSAANTAPYVAAFLKQHMPVPLFLKKLTVLLCLRTITAAYILRIIYQPAERDIFQHIFQCSTE